MNPEINGWPVVTVNFIDIPTDEDIRRWLAAMDQWLAREEPFSVVLLTKNKGMSPLARREQGIWFKQNKATLAQYCVGVARVVQQDQDPEKLAGAAMQNAMPFKLAACDSLAGAQELAAQWLA
jgi:hypothetical protein